MTNWVYHSLKRGRRSERLKATAPVKQGTSPGRPVSSSGSARQVANWVELCPTHALNREGSGVGVEFTRCVHCQRCSGPEGLLWQQDGQWSARSEHGSQGPLGGSFRRSLHVRFIDAGACGGCMGELRLTDAPQYNLHRYGIFLTPTPRDADVLLVAGPVTEAMVSRVMLAYEAMPNPKRVVAMGVCAINGGVFGQSFTSRGGVETVIPVDYTIAGCPPPPVAIIDALLRVAGQKPDSATSNQAVVS